MTTKQSKIQETLEEIQQVVRKRHNEEKACKLREKENTIHKILEVQKDFVQDWDTRMTSKPKRKQPSKPLIPADLSDIDKDEVS